MIIQYCVDCGAKLTFKEDVHYTCPNGHHYYNNARACTALIFIKDGKLLYTKRAKEPLKGMYDFPGGFVDHGETLEEAAKREAKEELGVTVKKLKYIGSGYNPYENDTHSCDAVFIVTDWEGDIKAGDDVAAVEWKGIDFMDSSHFTNPTYSPLKSKFAK